MTAPLKLYDTLSRKKSELAPLVSGRVSMYCCGITPYSNTHIGHTRTFFSYDLLHRVLCDMGLKVNWARNITDVDDKIILKAVAEKIEPSALVERYVSEQNEVFALFDLGIPLEPKVTESIPEILVMIEALVVKGYAYASDSGVYFRVSRFDGYGKLSKNKVAELRKGARIEVDESKEDPVDFALWKFAKDGEPQEVIWESPWGAGRPGWHIECSAMVAKCFGDTIDIHMGGRDLIFPHHECEIAQSEAASGKVFANHWLHCGMVTLYGEKMSKSTNHFVSISDFLSRYPAEVLRLVFLSASYSQPLDYTEELAKENFKKLAKIYRAVQLIDGYSEEDPESSRTPCPNALFDGLPELVEKMRVHVRDDLNTAAALADFFEFIRTTNQSLAALEKKQQVLNASDRATLGSHWPNFKSWMGSTLGLLGSTPQGFFEACAKCRVDGAVQPSDIEKLIEKRNQSRVAKEWSESDRFRDELLSHGIQIQDTPSGTKWTVQI